MSLFYIYLGDLTVVVIQDTFPSHFFVLLLLSETAHREESNLTLRIQPVTPEWMQGFVPSLPWESLLSAQAVAHRRKGRKSPAAFLTDSEEFIFLQGFSHLQPMAPA